MKFEFRPTFARCLLALLSMAVASGGARADAIDEVMQTKARKIVQELRAAKVKNVGVLKFKVEIPKVQDGPSYFAGRLPSLMATRLENILIMAIEALDLDPPIGVTLDASTVAAQKDRTANYDSPEACAKLFQVDYPLAWGKDKVKVDAFLAGLVKLSPDLLETTVTIQIIDPSGLKLRDLKAGDIAFTVPTTRSLMTDLNLNFSVNTRQLKDKLTLPKPGTNDGPVARLDEVTVAQIPESPKVLANPLDQGVEFKILYNGTEVARRADNSIVTPQERQKVTFTLKNLNKKEKVGVILRVNGVNTLGGDTDYRDPELCSMWVLDPDELYTIDGWYKIVGKKTEVERFKILPDDALFNFPLADETKRGLIELYVLREVEVQGKPLKLPGAKISFRQSPQRADDLKGAQDARVAMNTDSKVRGLIAKSPPKEGAPIPLVDFDYPHLVQYLPIRYFSAPPR